MIRKALLGAAALSLVVGGLAVGAGPASAAKPKMGGTLNCANTSATALFSPGLKLTVTKKILLTFTSNQSNCVVTNATAGAEAIKSVAISGTAKMKNADATGLLVPSPATAIIIKATLDFKNAAGTVLCHNKAKLGTGPTVISGENISFTASSLYGGKALGGKCFKGKTVNTGGILGQTVSQMGAAVASPNGITSLTIPSGTLSIP